MSCNIQGKEDKKERDNYKPITLQPVFFLKLIKKRMVNFIKATSGSDTRRFGFQEVLSTLAAVINVK